MESVNLRSEFASQSWTITGASVLGGIVIAPFLVRATTIFLTRFGLFPGSPEGTALVFVLPILLSFFVAEVGGGLLVSWMVGIPYFVFAVRGLWCYSGRLCAPRPNMLEILPIALVPAIIAGTIGYVIKKLISVSGGATN